MLRLLLKQLINIKNKAMTIKLCDKETKEEIVYESDFVPVIGDTIMSATFSDLKYRIVCDRLVSPNYDTLILFLEYKYDHDKKKDA
jgi:hypothetical protein